MTDYVANSNRFDPPAVEGGKKTRKHLNSRPITRKMPYPFAWVSKIVNIKNDTTK